MPCGSYCADRWNRYSESIRDRGNMTTTSIPLTLESLRDQLLRLAPELEEMARSLPQNNPDYERIVAAPMRLLDFLCKDSTEQLERVCRGYITFCDTFKQKQLDFVRKRHYAEVDYRNVNEQVYQNVGYMSAVYYPALLLSYLFSSNYFEIYRVFCDVFIPLCVNRSGASLEVGVGHGLLSASLLSANRNLRGYGLDISPVAPEVSSRVSSFFQLSHPVVTRVGDATAAIPLENGSSYQVMICAEVLEHLPDPPKLLRHMHAALDDDGILFVTASINMESVDHLYLFKSDDEVIAMVKEVGFTPIRCDLAFLTIKPYRDDPKLIAKLKKRENPATAIIIARKNRGS
jgi:2-polyprenyl-3-methyl-5-hydroxy-6-metoxy-1,4-benzoquinol methylase